jgi:hypothetical protein
MRANTFPLSKETHPSAFISIALAMSNRISSPLRSDTESKSLPFKLTPDYAFQYITKNNIFKRWWLAKIIKSG